MFNFFFYANGLNNHQLTNIINQMINGKVENFSEYELNNYFVHTQSFSDLLKIFHIDALELKDLKKR